MASMEETKTAQFEPPPNPPSAAQAPPPPQRPPKRPLDDDNSTKSKSLKIRVILRDLRPHFLEVLRTPDFRNCKAANEIQEQMKVLVELYKELMLEMDSDPKKRKVESQPEQPAPVKLRAEGGEVAGTYIIGGSAFGWNFITYSSKEPVYYGVTKESFRATQVTPPAEKTQISSAP
ncbi:hypothetical protein UlMin_028813 [Ulmus minor]